VDSTKSALHNSESGRVWNTGQCFVTALGWSHRSFYCIFISIIIFFSFSGWGEIESTWYVGHCWPIVQAPDDRWWLWSSRWNEDWQGKPKYSEKTCPSASLSTTDPTWSDLGSNPGRRGGKPATNRLSYGPAWSHRNLLYQISTFSFFFLGGISQCELVVKIPYLIELTFRIMLSMLQPVSPHVSHPAVAERLHSSSLANR
jgi:hypothetical protein